MAQPIRVSAVNTGHRAPAPGPAPDPGLASTLAILDMVFGPTSERTFDVRLWDGTLLRGGAPRKADFGIDIRRRGGLRRMLIRPSELSIVEAFISGDVDVTGNLESAMSIGDAIHDRIHSLRGALKLILLVLALPAEDDQEVELTRYSRALKLLKPNARRASSSEIQFHYDVGNEFYALWLEPYMQYTCGYYASEHDDLASAQVAKLEHICRKLRLAPGMKLLDIGCGWGGLVTYAAEHFGVEALGISLSPSQLEWANRRIAEKGLADRCRVELRDMRDLETNAQFDRLTSIGVTEHIPEAEQQAYFTRAYKLLKPGGMFMNQCNVSYNSARSTNSVRERMANWLWKRDQFIDRYVFPDGKIVPLGHLITKAEHGGFETHDVENLREHYTRTMRDWLRGLERHEREATAMVGERTYRVWRLYMTAAAYGFEHGAIGLAQILLVKPFENGDSGLPRTRADLYREPGPDLRVN
jgi:cyclopropane-fatty-acyl-phospholipid synthase